MNALPSPLAAPIVAALNHLIEQEPWACALLSPFAARVIRFDAAAFALGLTLFVITLLLNVVALIVVRRYRESYE